jgi:quercetin dioxygenase-like cupin family protein
VRSVRAVALGVDALEQILGETARRLLLVVSGTLELRTPDMRAELRAGDVGFVDLPDALEEPAQLRAVTDCLYLDVEVEAGWLPVGSVPPYVDDAPGTAAETPQLLRLRSDGQVAHLRPFDNLAAFDGTASQDVLALNFVCLSPSMSADWHTEAGTSLLVMLAGRFEVEVGGRGGRRVLRAGDVCLVEDFDGQGHRSSSHGETRFAVLKLPREHAWTKATSNEETSND